MPMNSSTYMAVTRQLIANQILRPAQRFFRKQVASGVLLLAATVFALVWANSNIAETYHSFWHTKISLDFGKFHISKSLVHWINDGLMALFFFTVGLEIKRELLVGELASPKKALLPVIAALGGMLVPALIYIAFNLGSSNLDGWGIPMATDIAFALGAVAIFGHNLPANLRIFLAAFAIADDLGAVLVIALFYTKEIVWFYVVVCVMLTFCLAIANFLWIRWTLVYAALGFAIWFFVLGSGIHPTVAGVIVSLFIPARGRYDTDRFLQNVDQIMAKFKCEDQSCGYSILLNQEHMHAVHSLKLACHDVETPLQRLMHVLHPWVAFIILPFFALSNTGLNFHGVNFSEVAVHTVSLGIFFGLVFGKPLGVMLFSFIAVKSKMGSLPKDVGWLHILGSAMLGGIGFTMSLFISDLSFSSAYLLNYAKMAILSASVLSAIIGISFLGLVSTIFPGKRLTSPDDPN